MKVSPIILIILFLLLGVLIHFTTPILTLGQLYAFIFGSVGTWIIVTLTTSHQSSPSSNRGVTKKPHNKKIIDGHELTTLYIGNLAYKVPEKAIKTHFEQYGYVDSVRLMKDRRSGKRKGFGFVEVGANDAQRMIDNLNDTEFSERTLKVRLAKEKGND